MAAQTLRPYQQAAVQSVLAALDPFDDMSGGFQRVLFTQPTGCGKTTTAAEIIRVLLEQGHRVLFVGDRKEILEQAFKRFRDHCHLSEYYMGMEKASLRCQGHERLVIGSIQSIYRDTHLQNWQPTVILVDECDLSAAPTYRKTFERFGVYSNKTPLIGFTATARRMDRQCLYAQHVDGTPVMVSKKKGAAPTIADPAESVFEKHVYEYDILSAIEDGWLVPVNAHAVQTETCLDGVKTVAGDFVRAQLEKTIDNAKRTLTAIDAWSKVAADRPTLVFCAGVEHAYHSAELFNQAGFKAAALDGETDDFTRTRVYGDFHAGRLQVLCNCGLYTRGADIPKCSCVIALRPTRSWNLFCQQAGRALRPLDGILNGMEEMLPEFRRGIIAKSDKPNAILLDVVDLYKQCGDLCTAPSLIDLPVKLDFQGHSITDTKAMIDRLEEEKERLIGACPITYEKVESLCFRIDVLRKSGAKSERLWDFSTEREAYVHNSTPKGYTAELSFNGDHDYMHLNVRTPRGTYLVDKPVPSAPPWDRYFESAAARVAKEIEQDKTDHPASRGTVARLAKIGRGADGGWLWILRRKLGYNDAQIDAMPFMKAKGVVDKYFRELKEGKA